jgi:hypothetical protein
MLQDIIIVENIFDDPYKIIDLAKKQKFYTKEEHPIDKNIDNSWHGLRSLSLDTIDKNFFIETVNNIINKSLSKKFHNFSVNYINWDFRAYGYFHLMLDQVISGIHVDKNIVYAGVIYLNPNPTKNSGTIFYNKNEEVVQNIDNKFNKLVLYNSSILHQVADGFGDNVENGRLTLNLFINSIKFYKD